MSDRRQDAGPEDLPQGWSYATLEQVSDPVPSVDPKTHFENGFEYIDISSIDDFFTRHVAEANARITSGIDVQTSPDHTTNKQLNAKNTSQYPIRPAETLPI